MRTLTKTGTILFKGRFEAFSLAMDSQWWWNVLSYMARRIKGADAINVGNQLTLEMQDYSGLSRWTGCNHKGS